ncbi:hypothetical protein ACMFMG_004814 [Clarireedia jacksonii]
MSCSLANHPMLFPTTALGSDDFANVCAVSNITSNSAAQSLLASCCGSAPVTTFFDGCYSYCNLTGSAQDTWTSCFKAGSASNGLDYSCTDGTDPFSASWEPVSASAGSTYLGGSSGTLLFPATTSSAAPSSGSATTTGSGPAATGNSTASVSSQSTAASKSTSSGKSSGSATATGSAANASSSSGAGPTVKQFSKGAVAIVALAFVGLMA